MNNEKLKGAILMLDNFDQILMFAKDKDGKIHGITKTEELQDLFTLIGTIVQGEAEKNQMMAQVKYEAIMFAIWSGLSMEYPEIYRGAELLKFFQRMHEEGGILMPKA